MTNISIKSLLKIIGAILLLEPFFYLLCLPVALIYSEPLSPFLLSIAITLIPGLILFFLIPHSIYRKLSSREGYLGVTLAWLVMTIAGTYPFLFSGTITDFPRAFFESMSGFTTTGASIFTEVENLPKSILFWRSLTHWIGGIGIIVLAIIILPTLKVGGYNLFSLEFSIKQKILPKTKSIARTIVLIYFTITTIEILFLLAGDMNLFDSLCITFGTVATGGFSTKNNSLASFSPYIQYVISFFMFISATSYVILYFFVKRDFKKILKNDEFGFYVFFVAVTVSVMTLILFFNTDRDFTTAFRHSLFQIIAQITTTGFATTDFMLWPTIGWFIMFLLLFAGGCTGSTTGGVKMARHLISLKNAKSMMLKLQHPNAVYPIRLNGRMIPDNINYTMLLFVFIYAIAFVGGAVIIIITGMPVKEAIAASASALANVGPGLGASGNMGNYAHFNQAAVVTMTMLMLIGRLEIFTVLAIFSRSFWKR